MRRTDDPRGSVGRLLRAIRLERGQQNEKRFFEAVENSKEFFPKWLDRFEMSTDHEDMDGVDAWAIVTETPRIAVQIKSSLGGVVLGRVPWLTAPVIVRAGDTDETIYRRAVHHVWVIRTALLSAEKRKSGT